MTRLALALAMTASVLACSSAPVSIDAGVVGRDAPGSDAGLADAVATSDAVTPDAEPQDSGPAALSFVEDIYPLFEARGCNTFACHGSLLSEGGVLTYMPTAREAYADLLERVSLRGPQRLLVPGAPDESLLVIHAESTLTQFNILTPEDTQLVRRWVAEGALLSRDPQPVDGGVSDGGAAPETCTMEGLRRLPELPAACLPRCARATWDQVIACRTAVDVTACQNAALTGDQTEAASLGGLSEPLPMNCDACVNWQTNSCLAEACEAELLAFNRCRAFSMACGAAQGALQRCASASADFVPCQRARDVKCVAP